jgi:hypothetical protein
MLKIIEISNQLSSLRLSTKTAQDLPQINTGLKDKVSQSHTRRKGSGFFNELPLFDRRIDENDEICTDRHKPS